MKKRILRHGTARDTLNAVGFTILIFAVAFFGFRLQTVKHSAADTVARQGSQLLLIDRMPEAVRAGAEYWYAMQDPTIPARGDAGVGFAVVPGSEALLVQLAELPRAVDPPEDPPAMPEVPAPAVVMQAEKTAVADFPLPVTDAAADVVLYRSDGSILPCPGLFRAIPSGKAVRSTVIRTIPVGDGLSRLVLTESCGDAALDSFAQQELSKIKFHAGNVITVCWSSSARAK